MLPLHPVSTGFKERVAVIISPWHIRLLQLMPDLFSSCRIRFFLKNTVLKFVHRHHKRNSLQCLDQMILSVQSDLVPKEFFHPRVGQKFHGHGVYLICLTGRPCHRRKRINPACRIRLKGVPHFVSQHVHVCARPIKVRENERRFHSWKKRTVSTRLFARFTVQVKHFMFQHKIEKFSRFLGKFMVHFLGAL